MQSTQKTSRLNERFFTGGRLRTFRKVRLFGKSAPRRKKPPPDLNLAEAHSYLRWKVSSGRFPWDQTISGISTQATLPLPDDLKREPRLASTRFYVSLCKHLWALTLSLTVIPSARCGFPRIDIRNIIRKVVQSPISE